LPGTQVVELSLEKPELTDGEAQRMVPARLQVHRREHSRREPKVARQGQRALPKSKAQMVSLPEKALLLQLVRSAR
jgi:hypothetical protein